MAKQTELIDKNNVSLELWLKLFFLTKYLSQKFPCLCFFSSFPVSLEVRKKSNSIIVLTRL